MKSNKLQLNNCLRYIWIISPKRHSSITISRWCWQYNIICFTALNATTPQLNKRMTQWSHNMFWRDSRLCENLIEGFVSFQTLLCCDRCHLEQFLPRQTKDCNSNRQQLIALTTKYHCCSPNIPAVSVGSIANRVRTVYCNRKSCQV